MIVALVVLGCIGLLVLAVQATREVDDEGDPITEERDPDDVTVSGDADAIATIPPPPAADAEDLDEIVERVFPARDSEVLRQQQVGIDLGARYTGVLIVNGIEIPETQLIRQPALNQVFFQPTDGYAVEELLPGRNCVIALVWRVTESRDESRSVDWCFEAT